MKLLKADWNEVDKGSSVSKLREQLPKFKFDIETDISDISDIALKFSVHSQKLRLDAFFVFKKRLKGEKTKGERH